MLSAALRLLFAPWRWAAQRALPLWQFLLAFLPPPSRLPPSPADATPLTDEQRRRRKTDYIQSLSTEAICALASHHNNGLSCRLNASTPTKNGSFNVCFFVEFYTVATRWVVRIPIEPIVHRVWEKLQSEVYTMQ